jgi:hypothetical protein
MNPTFLLKIVIIPHLQEPSRETYDENRCDRCCKIPISLEMWPNGIFLVPIEDWNAEESLDLASEKSEFTGERVDISLTAMNVPGNKRALKTAITFITALSRFV